MRNKFKRTIAGFASLAIVMSTAVAIPEGTIFTPLTTITASAAGGNVTISETTFPDANFYSYLSGLAGKNGKININNATDFEVSGKEIASLEGIENFTSLKTLDCSNNSLTTLDLSANTSLTTLDCSNNNLTSLDLSANTSLTSLTADNNSYDIGEVDCTKKVTLNLPSGFNADKVTAWNGATYDNGVLTIANPEDGYVTYVYDAGNNFTVTFKLTFNYDATHDFTVADVLDDNSNRKSEATCTANAVYYKSCSRCGEVSTSDDDTFEIENSKVDHTSEAVAEVPATCVSTGLTAGTKCSVCGEVLTAQAETVATGIHSYVSGKCSVCGDVKTLSVTVNYGTNNTKTATFAYGKIITVSASATNSDGYTFSYWATDPDGNKKVSTSNKYSFLLTRDTKLYAIYVAPSDDGDDTITATAEAEPTVVVSNVYKNDVSGKKRVAFEVTRSVPEGCDVQSYGIVYSTKNNTEDTLTKENISTYTTLKPTAKNGSYTLNFVCTSNTAKVIYARGYVTYKDDCGSTHTVYSSIATGCYNNL